MKAAFFNQHGGPEVMEYGDLPAPEVKPGEVLVQIKVAAMNRVDKWVRDGWPGLKLELPHILGSDDAGLVAESVDFLSGSHAITDIDVNLAAPAQPACADRQGNPVVFDPNGKCSS